MTDAYMGKFLVVNLSSRTHRTVPVPQWLKRDFIGGKGFGAKLLFDLAPRGIDPLAPGNPLMFLTGPLTGTSAPSMRACVVTKSPATGAYLDSFFGGRFGPEIRFAGYDGIIVLGSADRPVYLHVSDDAVEFRCASAIWGLEANTANARIKEELNAPDACLATIGPAGENRVRFALICCEYNRQAGRGGAGAVMGSKNLKAISVQGSRLVRVHDLAAFSGACRDATADIASSAECAALTAAGTSYAVSWSNEVGTLPTRNYRDQVDPKADAVGEPGQRKHLFLGKAACLGCPIRCTQMGAVRTGRHAHEIVDMVEYESAAMLGTNLLIHDPRAVAHLVKRCDELGMDSISAGSVLGFAFEAAESGAIAPPSGLDLRFGDPDCAGKLLEKIAHRVGELGDTLADGVKRASRRIGRHTEAYAAHVKGLECPGWGPRGTPGMGLAYMTADRGACHQRGFMIAYEVGGRTFRGQPVEGRSVEGKAVILKHEQDYLSGTDALVKCDFGAFGISAKTYARLLETATGRAAAEDIFTILGERIWNLTRLYNLREGITAADDRLPRRFVEEPLPSGPLKDQRISEADMSIMRAEYYRARGWDAAGRPTGETLERTGLDRSRTFSIEHSTA
ncbi:MAG: aldehyde ferredoxin oxidoreductase family protein [Desulfobacterales bacterium]